MYGDNDLRVGHCFGMCSLTFYIAFVRNYKLLMKISILSDHSLPSENFNVIVMILFENRKIFNL